MEQKISAFIITFNEEKIIAQCLEKLSWANEIIIVDSGSTDKTVDICSAFGAKVIYNKFENFSLQKQLALSLTQNNWVLSLDADEVLTDTLIEEIKTIDFSNGIFGYKIPRTHVFLNKKFCYGSENKKPILRLFDKNFGYFTSNKIHETIIVSKKTATLKNEMLHYTVFNVSNAFKKCVHYATLGGEFLFEKGKKTNVLIPVLKFPLEFLRVYFFQLNFLNGYQGIIWSYLSALRSFVKYAKLLELQQYK